MGKIYSFAQFLCLLSRKLELLNDVAERVTRCGKNEREVHVNVTSACLLLLVGGQAKSMKRQGLRMLYFEWGGNLVLIKIFRSFLFNVSESLI